MIVNGKDKKDFPYVRTGLTEEQKKRRDLLLEKVDKGIISFDDANELEYLLEKDDSIDRYLQNLALFGLEWYAEVEYF